MGCLSVMCRAMAEPKRVPRHRTRSCIRPAQNLATDLDELGRPWTRLLGPFQPFLMYNVGHPFANRGEIRSMSIQFYVRVAALVVVSLGFAGPAQADTAQELAAKQAAAKAAFHAGKCAKAIRLYRALIAAKYHPIYVFRIGQCQQYLEHYQGAVKSFERYLKDLSSSQCRGCPTKIQTQKRLAQVKAKLATALRLVKKQRKYAYLYFRQGRCRDAIRIYRAIMKVDYHPMQIYRIGQCYEYRRHWKQAISAYLAFVRDYAKHPKRKGQPTLAFAKKRIARLQSKLGGRTVVARRRTPPPTVAEPAGRPAPAEAQVDVDIAKAAMGKRVVLTLADGRTVSGTVRGVSAIAIILVKTDGLFVKYRLVNVRGLRLLTTGVTRAPHPGAPSHVAPPATPPPSHPSRYGVRSGYLGGGQQPTANPPASSLKIRQYQESYWAAKRLRGAGIGLTIAGLVLDAIGGGMFATDDGEAWIAGIALCSIGGLATMIGIPMWIAGAVKTRVIWGELQRLRQGQPVGGLRVPEASPHLARHRRGRVFKLGYTFRY